MSAAEPSMSGWRGFWLAPTDGTAAGLLRITLGAVMLTNAVSVLVDLPRYYSDEGILPWRHIARRVDANFSLISLAPTDDTWIAALGVAFVVASLALVLGVLPRLSAVLVWLLHLTFAVRNPYLFNGGDRLIGILAALIIFAPIDRRFTLWVPAFWRRQLAVTTSTVLSLRVIQIQVAWVYMLTGIYKAISDAWIEGYAMHIVFRHAAFARWPIDIDNFLVVFFAWSTVALEVLFPLVFFRRLRPFILVGGVLLHAGIEIVMLIPVFSWVMMASYVAYVPDDECRRWLGRIGAAGRRLLGRSGRPDPQYVRAPGS